MTWLVLGVGLWTFAHLFKRLFPARRAALGETARGLVALGVLAALVLMVIGFRAADGEFFWGRSPALVGINNLLTLAAVYLFAASVAQTRVTAWLRHPQLSAVILWAVAHLLVNGTTESFVLFGGLLFWALTEVVLINRQTVWTRPGGGFALHKEALTAVAAGVAYAAITYAHDWFGYPPFG